MERALPTQQFGNPGGRALDPVGFSLDPGSVFDADPFDPGAMADIPSELPSPTVVSSVSCFVCDFCSAGSVLVRTWLAAKSQHFDGLACSAWLWADARFVLPTNIAKVASRTLSIFMRSSSPSLLCCSIRFRPIAAGLTNDPFRILVRQMLVLPMKIFDLVGLVECNAPPICATDLSYRQGCVSPVP